MDAARIREADREISIGREGAWSEALEAWDARIEMREAKRAARCFQRIAEASDAPDAWAWCARAHFYLGDYASRPREAERLFERGGKLGKKALVQDEGHIPALFWTSCCLGRYSDSAGVIKGAVHVPVILRNLMRVNEQHAPYYHHGLARFLGQAFLRQPLVIERVVGPAVPDLHPERVIDDLRTSLEQDPPFALTMQTLGQMAHRFQKQTATVEEMLDRLSRLDPDGTPHLAPENQRDLPRARELLETLL